MSVYHTTGLPQAETAPPSAHLPVPVPVPVPVSVPAKPPRKRKRPKVPEQQRQRAAVACKSCRRLKEKCDGQVPCSRCSRYNRLCEPADAASRPASSSHNGPSKSHAERASPSHERVQHLEYIARHFLGDVTLTDDALSKIVAKLESESDGTHRKPTDDPETPTLEEERFSVQNVSANTTSGSSIWHYSGEFSHWNFSMRLKSYVEQQLGGEAVNQFQVLDYWRPHHLKSRDSSMKSILESLPGKDVALFLVSKFCQFAQQTTFFVEEGWVRERVNALYRKNIVLTADDACWLCSTLMVLAVGTQFAHMPQNTPTYGEDAIESVADAVGISFYQQAADLIPDIIAIASVDSVQAFLLLAHYALPLDAHGVAYTYLGLALRMAIQNGMHRKHLGNEFDAYTQDLRNRLWWSTYRLEKRVSILHGRPASISSNEVDADHPVDTISATESETDIRRLENSMTKITDWLGDMAFVIFMLRKSPPSLRHTYFERLLQIKGQYLEWWQSAHIPDINTMQQSRAVAHLHLSKHMNLVFVGRPFLLNRARLNAATARKLSGRAMLNERWSELAGEALRSAEQIVAIEQQMHATIGLAKASWVEFSACRAAVLVLLAQCLHESSQQTRDVLGKGMNLIRYMSSANASTRSEASLVTSLENAIRHLDAQRGHEVAETLSNFKNLATRFQGDTREPAEGLFDPLPAHTAGAFDMYEPFGDLDWSPFDASMFNETPIDFEALGMHHFDEAFSISNGSLGPAPRPEVPPPL